MTTITIDRAPVEQALEALEHHGRCLPWNAFVEVRKDLRDALAQQAEPLNLADPAVQKRLASQWGYVPAAAQAEPVEPVAWLAPRSVDSYSRPDLGYETCSKSDYGAFPAYTAPPRCPNCASLEAQNTELDDMLVAMEHAVAQAAAVERKACADICDAHASCEGIAQRCAAAIRARGQA